MHGLVCVCFLDVGFVFCHCVGWMPGLDFGLGLAGKSCGVTMLVRFPLANFVMAGLGCVHVWFGVCFPYRLALGFVNWLVACLDWIFVWVWLVRVVVQQSWLVFPLQTLLGFGWVECMCLCVCVCVLAIWSVLYHMLCGSLVGACVLLRCWDLTCLWTSKWTSK